MLACSYKTGNVSHIYHEICSDFLSDLSECREIDNSGVSRCSCKDQLWLELLSFPSDVFHIDAAIVIYIIEVNVIELTAEVYAGTVCKVSAVVKVKSEYCIARLED